MNLRIFSLRGLILIFSCLSGCSLIPMSFATWTFSGSSSVSTLAATLTVESSRLYHGLWVLSRSTSQSGEILRSLRAAQAQQWILISELWSSSSFSGLQDTRRVIIENMRDSITLVNSGLTLRYRSVLHRFTASPLRNIIRAFDQVLPQDPSTVDMTLTESTSQSGITIGYLIIRSGSLTISTTRTTLSGAQELCQKYRTKTGIPPVNCTWNGRILEVSTSF